MNNSRTFELLNDGAAIDNNNLDLNTRLSIYLDVNKNNFKEYLKIKYTKREYYIDIILLDYFFYNLIRYKDTLIT